MIFLTILSCSAHLAIIFIEFLAYKYIYTALSSMTLFELEGIDIDKDFEEQDSVLNDSMQ